MFRWTIAVILGLLVQTGFFLIAPWLSVSGNSPMKVIKEEGQKTYELETLIQPKEKPTETKDVKPLPEKTIAPTIDEIKPTRQSTFSMDLSLAGGGGGDGAAGGSGNGVGTGTGIGSAAQQVVYDAGQVEEEASVLKEVTSNMPLRAKREGVSGRVELFLVVEANGTVSSIQIIKEEPLGYGFGKEASTAMAGFIFKAAKIKGVPVRQKYRKQFIFEVL